MQFMLAQKDEMHLAPESSRGPTYGIGSGSEVIKMDETNGFCEEK